MLRKLLTFTVLFFVAVTYGFAQTGDIQGTVTDAQSGEPLPATNIYIPDLERGASTNANGEYTISNVPTGTYTIRATYIGYSDNNKTVEISSGENQVNFQMKATAAALDEVVVTGFGEESRLSTTSSISSVDVSKQLEKVPVISTNSALQGSAPGLQIVGSSGTPGSTVDINIRGINSINAQGNPLYIIDGVPVTSGEINNSTATSQLSLISSLDMNNIKDISVLKGPVATSRYGARGSNGVIVITTKQGTAGETNYSFNVQRGAVEPAVDGPGVLDAQGWSTLFEEAYDNAGAPSVTSPWDGETSTNWNQVVTNEEAVTQSYGLTASGGTEQATYYGSLGYTQQDGVVIGSELDRYNGRFNFGYQFSPDIRIDNNFTGSFTTQNGQLEGAAYFGNPVLSRYFIAPIYPAFNEDGSPNLSVPGVYHPTYTVNNDINLKEQSRLINSTKLAINILDNLSFSTQVGVDYNVLEEKYHDNPVYGDGATTNGFTQSIYTREFKGSLQNTLNYIWDINPEHSLDISLIQNAEMDKFYRISASGQQFATPGLTNLANAGTPTGAFSYQDDYSILGVLGTAKYSFSDQLFVDASLRYEGNSRFSPDYRFGTFYSIGAAYILTEDLITDVDFLDLLKVRAEYGVSGNDAIGINQYQSFLGYQAAYAGAAGAEPTQLGNTQLTWEDATTYEFGTTIGLFNRVDFEAAYFNKTSSDLLLEVPLSLTTSFSDQASNVGEVVNKGFEFSLNADVIRSGDFQWNLGGNLTLIDNEVTEMPADATGELLQSTTGTKYEAVQGYPIDSWYMKTWAGVDPETGNPLWELNDGSGELTSNYAEAQAEYQDASTTPTTYGSINTRVDFKGFYVGANLYYSFGNKVYDTWGFFLASDGVRGSAGAFNQYDDQLDRWQEPGDQTDVPRRVAGGNMSSNATSSRYLYDGGFLRLQTLRAGYNVPATFLSELNVGLSSLNIYMVGNNMWTYRVSDELEYDPAVGNAGFLNLFAPALKSVTAGIEVEF